MLAMRPATSPPANKLAYTGGCRRVGGNGGTGKTVSPAARCDLFYHGSFPGLAGTQNLMVIVAQVKNPLCVTYSDSLNTL